MYSKYNGLFYFALTESHKFSLLSIELMTQNGRRVLVLKRQPNPPREFILLDFYPSVNTRRLLSLGKRPCLSTFVNPPGPFFFINTI